MGKNSVDAIQTFAKVGVETWRKKVAEDLRLADLASLRRRDINGLYKEPLYTITDAVDGAARGLPGSFPHVRGADPQGGWVIRQEFDDCRVSASNQAILTDVNAGVSDLWLKVRFDNGIQAVSAADFGRLLKGVEIDSVSICLDPGSEALPVAAAYLGYLVNLGVDLDEIRGGFGADPLGTLAKTGGLPGGRASQYEHMVELAQWCSVHTKYFRAALVDTGAYHNAGASEVQQLAYAIGTGVVYLRALMGAGLSIDAAASQIMFAFSISDDFFTEIAKLRAARWLWSRVVSAAGGNDESAAMRMHCRTSNLTLTERDPWVNMLRVTNQAAAAALGGAGSIATASFDEVIGPPDDLSRRVARNTQIILQQESHLSSVIDPAGGSWYVEQRTDALARDAWAKFQTIEAGGGFEKTLLSGKVVDAISEIASTRRNAVAKRKSSIVGVSEFASIDEAKVERKAIDGQEVANALRKSLLQADPESHQEAWVTLSKVNQDSKRKPGALVDGCVEVTKMGGDILTMASVLRQGLPDLHIEPLRSWRLAEEWEALRDASDARLAKVGRRPRAFMANLGPIAAHKPRSMWATNLLAAAGIESSSNDGFVDVAEIVKAWQKSEADLAVICGSDDQYRSQAVDAIKALVAGGCTKVAMAGRPGEHEAQYTEAGVDVFLFTGCDALQILAEQYRHQESAQ